jgi:APA family basic amino acid/polyamine antiporter
MQTPTNISVPEAKTRASLLRVLGVGFGIAVIIGNTIGAGILRTPGDVAQQLPDKFLFIGVWLAGGVYALLGAISLAELGAMLPRAGGQYVYARYALGDYAGFVVGWSDWLSTCGTTAAVALVVGEYAGVLFPVLAGEEFSVALLVTIAFTILQWRGVRWGGAAQNLTSALKTIALVALVAACFILGGNQTPNEPTVLATPNGFALLLAFIFALQSVIYTYDGWTGVLYVSEEMRQPGRSIPRAMFGGVFLVIAIYLLVNLALLRVLPIAQIARSDLAVGAAAQAIFGGHGDTIIRALMIVSLLSSINANQLFATRTLFAMSRDEFFSNKAARVNAGGTPTVALLLSTLVVALFILGGKKFETIIAALAFFFVANYTISFISVFVLRRRKPEKERPYRAFGYPLTTALSLILSVAFLFGAIRADTRHSLYALALLAASYPVFRVARFIARR